MSRIKDATENPTEMEAVVLGYIWQNGPCTAYAIRKSFSESVAPRWSGSAGAIYPLMRRLEELDLVICTQSKLGNRKKRKYSLSKLGKKVLRGWVRNLDTEIESGLIHDPLRSKLLFIDLLTENQVKTFVESAINDLRNQLLRYRELSQGNSIEENRSCHIAARNMLLLTKARIEWLEEILRDVH